ncbi:MAG: MdtA/MuxA family multidrug efflux RND transporter periplasmic adaptor subunit [Zoogloea sp.]|nr:MdtA/MuxA family multidrug efflux RND transporter periplasmic adaptor subunit [Zoogloea sp.]
MSSSSNASSPSSSPASPSKKRRLWSYFVGLAVLAAGGWYATHRPAPDGEGGGKPADGRRGGPGGPGGRGDRPIPVTLETIATRDVRVVVPALGSVVPRNQVVVRARVDGPLLAVKFTEGQPVKAGEVLALIDPEPFKAALEQARGTLARDAALLKNAKIDLERYRGLLAQDSIAKQQVDTQEALVRQYQGTVQADEAAVKSAELQLSYTTIKAPIAGRAGLRTVDPGNMVKASDTNGLVTIAQVSPITAVFAVPEDRLPAIMARVRSGAGLGVEAWDRDMKQRLAEGKLLAVDSLIDTTTGTVKLKAEFANKDGSLFPNQFVNVRLLLDTLSGVVAVPTAALQQGAKGRFVYRLGEGGKVAAVPVKLGATDGGVAVVEDGLAAGDKVVVDGLDKLKDGAMVEAIDPKAVDAPGREKKRGNGGGRPGH